MRIESLLLPSHPPGVCVPSLPCRSQEADGKQEESEVGPRGLSLDGIQWGLGLAFGSDSDKLGDGRCHRPIYASPVPAPCQPLCWQPQHPKLPGPGSCLWSSLSGRESRKQTITT